jgi:formate dehydrogenase subunit gamma
LSRAEYKSGMESLAIVARIIEQQRARPGALLPMLHEIQEALGCIPPEAVPPIAQALNLSRAEVHGVISYYAHFRQTPPGRHVVRVCCAEACQAVGGEALAEHARARLAGSDITLEPVYCLGLCACGPSVQVDEATLHARMTPEKFDALIATLEAAP